MTAVETLNQHSSLRPVYSPGTTTDPEKQENSTESGFFGLDVGGETSPSVYIVGSCERKYFFVTKQAPRNDGNIVVTVNNDEFSTVEWSLSDTDLHYSFIEDSQWSESVLESIESIASLPDNWNGYNSPPFTSEARQVAIGVVELLKNEGLPEPNVVPIAGGGLQFEWDHQGRELELEIDPAGDELIYLKVYEDETMEEDSYLASENAKTLTLINWLKNG